MRAILKEITDERLRQEELHGDDSIVNLGFFHAYAVLGEEVGELGTAMLQLHEAMPKATPKEFTAALNHMREEAIQVAACAVAIVEAADGGRYG